MYQDEADPILQLLNFKSKKRVHDLPSSKVEICSIELLKLQLEAWALRQTGEPEA